MLYLTIPLGIALVATLAAVVIVLRKMSYLRKLTPESHEMGDTVLHDYAPEAVEWFKGIPWRQYLHRVLATVEGFLDRVRTAMFSLGRASDSIMKSVRRAGQQAAKSHEVAVAQRVAEKEEKKKEEERDLDELDMEDPADLKAEEQRLIVAIAQNPRDPKLYSDLARVYMRLGSYTDATEALKEAVKLEPDNEEYGRRLERAKNRKAQAAPAA